VSSDYYLSVRELAHEVAQPLTTARLHLQLLHRELYSPASNQEQANLQYRVAQALLSLEHASHLLETEKTTEPEEFTPSEIIYGVINVLQPVALSAKSCLVFHNRCKKLLYGNSIFFQQIVNNLIYNSVDAYKLSKKEKNRLILISVNESTESIMLKIQDFADGIFAANLPHIFTPGVSTKGKSRGLGLALVKRLVEDEFHGTISVSSQVDHGTTFAVSLPLCYNTREPKTAPFS
jgi:two-component system, sporulation sensor kinase D